MKKSILNEEVIRIRQMMGLNENLEELSAKDQFKQDLQNDPDYKDFKDRAIVKGKNGGIDYSYGAVNPDNDPFINKTSQDDEDLTINEFVDSIQILDFGFEKIEQIIKGLAVSNSARNDSWVENQAKAKEFVDAFNKLLNDFLTSDKEYRDVPTDPEEKKKYAIGQIDERIYGFMFNRGSGSFVRAYGDPYKTIVVKSLEKLTKQLGLTYSNEKLNKFLNSKNQNEAQISEEHEMPYYEDQSDIDEKIKKYMEWHEITDMTQGIKDYMALCLWKSDEATSEDNQEGEALWFQRYNAAKAKLNSTMNEGAYDGRYDQTHGSPYDRGHADAYYGRARNPHKWPEGTGHGEQVTDLTPEEIEAYNAGYDDCDDRKDWGIDESGFQGEPNFQLPADGVLNEEGDEISLSMATMSHLSDLQEQAPELSGKINFIKALVMKMECKTKVSTEELDALHNKYIN